MANKTTEKASFIAAATSSHAHIAIRGYTKPIDTGQISTIHYSGVFMSKLIHIHIPGADSIPHMLVFPIVETHFTALSKNAGLQKMLFS